jgi:hypothetical protein
MRSGRQENLPYSLSRWTDVPAAKWDWFRATLAEGSMMAFSQRDLVPTRWSVKPADTLGLVFWTKDPSNLLRDHKLVKDYDVHVHVTVTGWEEVEKGAPNLIEGTVLLQRTAYAYGPDNVTWRFSPVPILPDEEVADRFGRILAVAAPAGIRDVYLSFLQPNDLVTESRTQADRIRLMSRLAAVADPMGVRVRLCNEDRTLAQWPDTVPENLSTGICAPPERFSVAGSPVGPSEGCGCALMVDPFNVNESCTFGCTYCYAADRSISTRKRSTTRGLKVIR